MVIAGGTIAPGSIVAPSSCFNGAGDGDRRRALQAAGRILAPAASTEPAMVIAGGIPIL